MVRKHLFFDDEFLHIYKNSDPSGDKNSLISAQALYLQTKETQCLRELIHYLDTELGVNVSPAMTLMHDGIMIHCREMPLLGNYKESIETNVRYFENYVFKNPYVKFELGSLSKEDSLAINQEEYSMFVKLNVES